MKAFDVIVVGAGHAGLEAAFICHKAKLNVCLITLDKKAIALTPCNPSIGGPAKGIVTREIDALGGVQAKVADATCLQIKMLNTAKGPGVWALRAQIDKIKYHEWFIEQLDKSNIHVLCDEVVSLVVSKNKVIGVNTKNNGVIKAKRTIVTTGTYLNSCTHIGNIQKQEGPQGLARSNNLSQQLIDLGFTLLRFKTGTPPRIAANSINYQAMKKETGDNKQLAFSLFDQTFIPFKKQAYCYLTFTNDKTHKIINDNIKKSAMYSGNIKGKGPRYCPSIEDKVVRFYDKPRHQLFVEPESKSLNTMYLQGLSTSFPADIQEKIVHSIVGLEKAKIVKYAYAIEYDVVDPTQLWPTLETKLYKHLYFAGQVNGTSGYEEAACQGLMSGINAILSIKKQPPFILKRDEAYIGVLIDDLVTKGVLDPYRLLTSRAEHRLSLRNDNADERLLKYGYKFKTITSSYWKSFQQQTKIIDKVIHYLKSNSLKKIKLKTKPANHNLYDLLKNQKYKLKDIIPANFYKKLNPFTIGKIEILVKYSGYIKNQTKFIERFEQFDNLSLAKIKDYKLVPHLSLEGIDKLNHIRPLTLGQAKRISGVNITDLTAIKYYLDQLK